MKKIELAAKKGKGLFTLVDDDDFERVSQLPWYKKSDTHNIYAKHFNYKTKYRISLHRFIMNAKDTEEVDHINGDTLDNRKSNLRICTHAQNVQNARLRKRNKTGYIGVNFHKRDNMFTANIQTNKKQIWLGYFKTAIEAARIYNEAAKKLHGEFARLNDLGTK